MAFLSGEGGVVMNNRRALRLRTFRNLALCAVGSWYSYRSYQNGTIREDATEMKEHLRKEVSSVAPNMGSGTSAQIGDFVKKLKGNH